MRKIVYQIVFGVLEEGNYSDVLFHGLLQQMPGIANRDKKFIKRVSYGTIERAVELDAYIRTFSSVPVRRLDAPVRTVLRIGMYEILYMDSIPEAVTCHEAVELLKKVAGNRYAGFVNGVLRSMLRKEKSVTLRPWEELSLPKNLYEHLVTQYGKKTAKKIGTAFFSRKAEVTLHIDRNKISVSDYVRKLEEEKVDFRKGMYHEDAFIIRNIEDVKTLPGYEEGWFFVQDESSMFPVMCADVKPGDEVFDLCASPGGKSMHALLKMNGKGTLHYRDVSEKKIQRIQKNVKRMKYTNACGKVWDGTKKDVSCEDKADVMLADVPCSGIGIIGKKPEIKYHAMQEIESLVPIQRKICEMSLPMLRKGGVFLYSTCTISEKENQENVHWLEENCGLVRESINDYLPACLQNKMTEKGMLQMLPGIHESDGFFLARLRKV